RWRRATRDREKRDRGEERRSHEVNVPEERARELSFAATGRGGYIVAERTPYEILRRSLRRARHVEWERTGSTGPGASARAGADGPAGERAARAAASSASRARAASAAARATGAANAARARGVVGPASRASLASAAVRPAATRGRAARGPVDRRVSDGPVGL